ncbi:hypothetical protein AMECASPLE_004557 [Ameca splendens]|uniref:Uncharacterized protein n=1 Tax=Ameca splendens TaxID=208324 RepID=A0ABV0YYA0_9TELE
MTTQHLKARYKRVHFISRYTESSVVQIHSNTIQSCVPFTSGFIKPDPILVITQYSQSQLIIWYQLVKAGRSKEAQLIALSRSLSSNSWTLSKHVGTVKRNNTLLTETNHQ